MVIGLTGGIGSGKSSVAALLAKRGATIIDTDAIAREVVEPPSPVFDAIHYEFGSGVMTPDGRLNREALARIVFADPRQRDLLNRLTHPAIRERTLERIQALPSETTIVVVVPLLFESGFDKLCDTTVAVIAEPDVRRARVAARDQVSEESVGARMSAQLSDDEYIRRAHHVINNEGDANDLERRVDELWRSIASNSAPS